MKKKLFIISKNFGNLFGGAENSLIEIAKLYEKKGYQINYFNFSSSIKEKSKSGFKLPKKWNKININSFNVSFYFFYLDFFLNFFNLIIIRKYINKTDKVIINGNFLPIHNFIDCKNKILSIRALGELGIDRNNNPRFTFKYFFKIILNILNFSPRLIWKSMVFNSKAAEYHFNSKYLIKIFKGQNNLKLKLKYIPPIIDKNIIQKFRNLKKKNVRKGIVLFGNSNYKGVHIFKKIADYFKDEIFYIFDLKHKKKTKVKNIYYLPWISSPNQYSYAKLVLIPSVCGEAYSRTAVEAQLLKIKLLVSDDAGLKYSVKNKKIRIKNFKNEKSWIKKIKEII
tara:strand:+ start:374 stop:1390 length:1017 start_codon:yes stop_codon:yes gene_type:complete